MTREEALKRLREARTDRDQEKAHSEADAVLLALVDDDEIRAAWDAVPKWYA